MNQGERALLAGAPEVGYATRSAGWNGLWQNAVGRSMGRDDWTATHVEQGRAGEGVAATIWAELTR